MQARRPKLNLNAQRYSPSGADNPAPGISTSNSDLRPLRRSVPCRRGFTLVEASSAAAILAILAGVLFPVFVEAEKAKRLAQAQSDAKQFVIAMLEIFADDGDYPLTLTDERLPKYLGPALASKLDKSLNDDHEIHYPYYILSVRQGKAKGDFESWDFRIAAGTVINPVHLTEGSNSVFDVGAVGRPEGYAVKAKLFRTGTLIPISHVGNDVGVGDDYWWPWKDEAAPRPNQRHYDLPFSLLTARAAESVTPLLEDHPELSTQIRANMKQPETTTQALSHFSPAWFAPFDDILRLSDDEIEDLSELDLTKLQGDPAYLFSYESLRVLSTLYSNHEGITSGLVAKLDAAEAAETRGNVNAKRGQITAFQNQVRAQTGKALNGQQARTMLALSKTL